MQLLEACIYNKKGILIFKKIEGKAIMQAWAFLCSIKVVKELFNHQIHALVCITLYSVVLRNQQTQEKHLYYQSFRYFNDSQMKRWANSNWALD